jgi:membrane associated rhomboid family serine protease
MAQARARHYNLTQMNGDQPMAFSFPKPGRGLRAVLIVILALGIANAILFTWVPEVGSRIFDALDCNFERLAHGQVWRLVTSGLLTNPASYGHLFFTLLGLYFLAPDLERRWGSLRLVLFLAYAVVAGNLTVLAVDLLAPVDAQARFHPPAVFGASAAIAAIAIAWARDNATATVRLFLVVPIQGKWLLWATVGIAVLDLVFPTMLAEGIVAPLGGVGVGLLFGGRPSFARTLFLRTKLLFLQRRTRSLSVADVLSGRRPGRARSKNPLRVVPGGADDELRKRNPSSNDKRYLN